LLRADAACDADDCGLTCPSSKPEKADRRLRPEGPSRFRPGTQGVPVENPFAPELLIEVRGPVRVVTLNRPER
jgi:hypothetical protein